MKRQLLDLGPSAPQWDPENDWALADEEEVDPDLAARLAAPSRVPRWGRFRGGKFVHVAFDGGASRDGIATAGYIIADAGGRELVRKGIALGSGLTCNDAESTAVKLALQHLAQM